MKNVVCNFKKICHQRCESLEGLIQHLKSFHSSSAQSTSDVPALSQLKSCKCNMALCQGRQFSSVQELMTHWNCFHSNEMRDCIFLNCQSTFGVNSTSRSHFQRQHKLKNLMELKERHLVLTSTPMHGLTESSEYLDPLNMNVETEDLEDYSNEDLELEYENEDFENINTEELVEETEDFYLQYYSDFLNRLINYKHVPVSTVKLIAEEYLLNSRKSLERREKLLRQSLGRIGGISEADIEKVVQDVTVNDPFISAQLKLNSEYKLKKYIQENMCYIQPQEIVLNKKEVKNGKKKEVLHYIPIDETFKALLEDHSMIKMMKMRSALTGEEKLYDVKDGSLYHNNEYFKANPDSYTAMLYSDGVEIKNPLGAARGCYKIVQVFMTLGEIDKAQRSQIDRVQLVMIFREKLLKKYSLKQIFKPIVTDLLKLEKGIEINVPHTRIEKCGLLCYSADNLEAHYVGGWSGSFSSKYICRFCLCQYNQLQDRIHDYTEEGSHDCWTKEEYNRIVNTIEPEDTIEPDEDINDGEAVRLGDPDASEENPSILGGAEDMTGGVGGSSEEEEDEEESEASDEEDTHEEESDEGEIDTRGVKRVCPFNVLASFHSVGGFPPDIMHDIMEGVIPSDLLAINRILCRKGCFSISQYNEALHNYEFSSYERNDKPYPLPTVNSVKKCRGKAVSQWVHSRIWPLLIMKFDVDKQDPVLRFGLLLHEIVERLTAGEFYIYEVDILEEKIVEYLNMRKDIRAEFPSIMPNAKPKHHFMRKVS